MCTTTFFQPPELHGAMHLVSEGRHVRGNKISSVKNNEFGQAGLLVGLDLFRETLHKGGLVMICFVGGAVS